MYIQKSESSSIFAYIPGELKSFNGYDGEIYKSKDFSDFDEISYFQLEILKIINEFEFITIPQILEFLRLKKIMIETNAFAKNVVNLVNNKFISRYFFVSDNGKSKYKVYCLANRGINIVKAHGIVCNWNEKNNSLKKVIEIKERLLSIELIFTYKRNVSSFLKYEIKPSFKARTIDKIFKTTGPRICIKNKNRNVDFIFEIVRQDEKWKEKFENKVILLQDFFSNPRRRSEKLCPILIFVCENTTHCIEAYKILEKNKIDLLNKKVYFSTDEKQIRKGENGIFMKIRYDDMSYEIKNLKLNLWN